MKPRHFFTTCVQARIACLLLLAMSWLVTFSQTPPDHGWQVGYGFSVGATITKGDTMYVGGDFDCIGRYTGSLGEVDLSTGAVRKNVWPVVNGPVRVMLADGAGGWFIGGKFTQVDGYPRAGIAHITGAKKLDLLWNISVNDGASVDALLLSPTKDTLWVGGSFSQIGGFSRDLVAAIKVSTKTVIPGWGPGGIFTPNWWGPKIVSALAYYPSTGGSDVPRLFIGGDFGISWSGDKNLTILNPSTGAVLASAANYAVTHVTDPVSFQQVYPVVRSILVYGSYFHVGGAFSQIKDGTGATYTRESIAQIDVITGKLNAGFDIQIKPTDGSSRINCMKLLNTPSGMRMAVGGRFQKTATTDAVSFTLINPYLNGGGAQKYDDNFGGYAVSGGVRDTTYTPNVYKPAEIFNFETVGSVVYLAGNFEGIDDRYTDYPFPSPMIRRRNLASLDLASNKYQVGNFFPQMQTDMAARTINISGTDVIVGGDFTALPVQYRVNVAAVSVTQDLVYSFNPRPDSYVNDFAFSTTKDTLYMAGNFTTLGGSTQRGYTAAFRITDNTLLPWSTTTGVGGGVEDIVLDPTRQILYAGGKFSTINGQARGHLAAFDAKTGALLPNWKADIATINGQITPVRSLVFWNDTLYIGGRFDNILGTGRKNLAAVQTSPGPLSTAIASLLSWNCPVIEDAATSDIGVNSLVRDGSTLFVGGKFTSMNGVSLTNLGAIGIVGTTHTVMASWAPKVEYGGIWCMYPINGLLFVGGDFGQLQGSVTSFAGLLNISDASLVDWKPYPTKQPGGVILTMVILPKVTYLGGSHEAVVQSINDAVFHLSTFETYQGLVLSNPLISFTASKTSSGNLIRWSTNVPDAQLVLERSTNGISFSTIASYSTAAGGTYTDREIQQGRTYYYRLRIINRDNSTKYSVIRQVNGDMAVHPYLVSATAGEPIKVINAGKGSIVTLLTAGGQTVMQQRVKEGYDEITASKLSKGIYFYTIITEDRKVESGKCVVQ